MKTLDVLNRKELRKEYRLSRAFIKQHDALLGGIGKPRIYDRSRVEMVLREMMDERAKAQRPTGNAPNVEWLRRRVVGGADVVVPLSAPGRIQGRGGRGGQAG